MRSRAPAPVKTLAGALALLAAAAVVPQVFSDPAQDLQRHMDGLMGGAVGDVAVSWLDVVDATGRTANRSVQEAALLTRLTGGLERVALNRTTVTGPGGVALDLGNATAARDHDGSVPRGVVNDDDLARLPVNLSALADPWRGGEELELTLRTPDAAALRVLLQAPRPLEEGVVTLEVVAVR